MTRIEANNIFINYDLEGTGKAIVFIHGLSDSLKYWKVLQSDLKKDYQTLSYDLRAHGKTSDGDGEITIDLYTEDLFCLLEKLDISRAVLIGLSLGGNIAMNFAISHPEMVSGLVIMSSFSEFSPEMEEIFDKLYVGIIQGFVEFYDAILPYTLPEDIIEKNKDMLEFLKHEASKTANIEGIKSGIKAGYGLSLSEKLNTIKAPAIIISGADDNLTDLDMQKKIHDNIENSEMIILEKTKHNVLIGKNRTRILDIIKKFMLKIS